MLERYILNPLKELAERQVHDDWRDIGEGLVGAMGIAVDFATPFLRRIRSRWGVDDATARKRFPGDELVAKPSWCWTHGVEIDAAPEAVWPWIAQMGQNKGGFYSYQWLENLTGCDIENAEAIHPEWTRVRVGDELRMHPGERFGVMPIVSLAEGRWFLAHASFEPAEEGNGVSWLFCIEPLPEKRSRLISRFRSRYPNTLKDRLQFGYLAEAIGFVMDRRMLLGVKRRVERATTAMRSVARAAPRCGAAAHPQ